VSYPTNREINKLWPEFRRWWNRQEFRHFDYTLMGRFWRAWLAGYRRSSRERRR
jgi:hypothetical protein